MIGIAAGDFDEAAVTEWLTERISRSQ